MEQVVLFWFRRDLRLDDNCGLFAAFCSGLPVVPLFIFDTDILLHLEDKDDKRVSFIYAALQHLQEKLTSIGCTLEVRYGKHEAVLAKLSEEYSLRAVYTNHDYEPYAQRRDEKIKLLLAAKGILLHTFKDQVIFEKADAVKGDGTGYLVFTPYAKMMESRVAKRTLYSFCIGRSAFPFL